MNKVNKSLISAVSSVLKAACCAVLQDSVAIRSVASLGFGSSSIDTHREAALAMVPVTAQTIVIQDKFRPS